MNLTLRLRAPASVAVAMVAAAVFAQDAPLIPNWTAPPYWTPPATGQTERAAGEMQASALALPSSPLPFVAIVPCRIVDTRVALSDGFHQPAFANGETRTYNFPASTGCPGLPATAGAYSVNVNYRPLSQASYLTAFPTGTTMPVVATVVGYSTTTFTGNAAIVPAGTSGQIDVYSQYAAHVVIDINGYYEPQSVVTSLNTLTGDLTLAPGANVTITPSAGMLTIAATGGPGGVLPAGTTGQTLYSNGSGWIASSSLTDDGTNVGVTGILSLSGSSAASGQIVIGGIPVLHDFGSDNAFLGGFAGNFTMSGNANTGLGWAALDFDTTGHDNTATGFFSLTNNHAGAFNTASGSQTLFLNDSGTQNSAFGVGSLYGNTTGSFNTGVGANAGNRSDTIVGYDNVSAATFVQSSTGSWNTFVGEGTGATAQVDNCTAIGVDAYCTGTNQVRLGNRFVGSIGGEVGWSALSDLRAKTDVRDLDLGLDFVLALRPVAYRLRSGNGKTDMGFVAQEIEALLGDGYNVLDIGGDAARTLSLRHTDLIAPLVKAIQEQQATISAQQAAIQTLKAALAERDRVVEQRLAALEHANR